MRLPNVNRKYKIDKSFRAYNQTYNYANKSSETYLPCGVPQGTILRPLLFLLYINDLPNCIMHSQSGMYADDTSITYASNDVEEIERCVNIDLDRIRIWLAEGTNFVGGSRDILPQKIFKLGGSEALFSALVMKFVRKIDLEYENGIQLQVTIIKTTESK